MGSERMAHESLVRNLARVASLEYQVRWCLNGTAQDYVLLDELLGDTLGAAERRTPSKSWDEDQRQALQTFVREASHYFTQIKWHDESVSPEQIIHSTAMKEIRKAAHACLLGLGVLASLDELVSE
jgi:hypothetical protein